MPTRQMLIVAARRPARRAALLVIACSTVGQHDGQVSAAEAPGTRETPRDRD